MVIPLASNHGIQALLELSKTICLQAISHKQRVVRRYSVFTLILLVIKTVLFPVSL